MKLQGSGVFHPKTLQSQNCQRAENRLSLNGLEFVHGQLFTQARSFASESGRPLQPCPLCPESDSRPLPEPDMKKRAEMVVRASLFLGLGQGISFDLSQRTSRKTVVGVHRVERRVRRVRKYP
jgi:hypothetical protein